MKAARGIDPRVLRDVDVLREFIVLFCDHHHPDLPRGTVSAAGMVGRCVGNGTVLCAECAALLQYAASKRITCPYDPKPSCKKCVTHCYRPDYRQRIREVMRFSGIHLIKKGKLGLLKKYFF